MAPTRVYRMTSTQFELNFHPTNYGILENICQIMVSGMKGELEQARRSGLRAELHELQVCKTLRHCEVFSNQFLRSISTDPNPNSSMAMRRQKKNAKSLLDILWCVFHGTFKVTENPKCSISSQRSGLLIIQIGSSVLMKNGHHTIEVDWSKSSGSAIQWIALHKDDDNHYQPCQVTRGYCVTVTYKLFLTEGVGGPLKVLSSRGSSCPPLTPAH